MIMIQFYGTLRMQLRRESLEIPAVQDDCIRTLLPRVERGVNVPILHKLLDEQGALRAGTIILVNRRNIHHLQKLDTAVKAGDTVAFFPPGAGG